MYRANAYPGLRAVVRHEEYADDDSIPEGVVLRSDKMLFRLWAEKCAQTGVCETEFGLATRAEWFRDGGCMRPACAHEFMAFCEAFPSEREAWSLYAPYPAEVPMPYTLKHHRSFFHCMPTLDRGQHVMAYGITAFNEDFDRPLISAWGTTYPSRRLIVVPIGPPEPLLRRFLDLFQP